MAALLWEARQGTRKVSDKRERERAFPDVGSAAELSASFNI